MSLRLRLIGGSSDASEVDVPALVSALGGAGNRARGGRGKGGGGGGKSVWSKLLLLSLRLSKLEAMPLISGPVGLTASCERPFLP